MHHRTKIDGSEVVKSKLISLLAELHDATPNQFREIARKVFGDQVAIYILEELSQEGNFTLDDVVLITHEETEQITASWRGQCLVLEEDEIWWYD
jgi:hypothetical protein